jgi:hypothetical protein
VQERVAPDYGPVGSRRPPPSGTVMQPPPPPRGTAPPPIRMPFSLYSFILKIKLYDLKTEVNQNKVKLIINELLNECLTANQK